MKIFPHGKIEFYGNSGVNGSLLRIRTNYKSIASPNYRIKFYIEGEQYNKTSLLFKNNELVDDSSLIFIETGMDDDHSPRLSANNTEFIFENNTIITLHKNHKLPKIRIAAVLLFFQTAVSFSSTHMLFVNNSAPEGGIFVMVDSVLYVDGDYNHAKFENNEGYDGGAMTLHKRSYITADSLAIKIYAHFVFNNNLAHNRGGAIFVEDIDYIESFGHMHAIYFVNVRASF